jgi:LCP family protein required for cell wall assembly
MADRRRGSGDPPEGSPEYNWLYGAKGSARGQGGVPGDPDPTQVLPTSKRPPESAGQGAWGSSAPRTDRPSTAPRGPRPSTQPPRSASRGRKRFGWVKLVLLLWLVFLVAVPLWAWSQIEKVDAEPDGERPGSQPGHTYLLVGSDSREGLSKKQRQDYGTGTGEGRRTDTIMMLHTGAGPNLLLSIPRDSIVDVPGYGQTKVNAAYAYGGPELLVQTLEEETGVGIDSYVEIGFGGFVNVVDAVGGVEICPKQAMKDPQANLDIPRGCQEADGKTALGYARSRKTYAQLGDIDRARAQREVVSAIGSKALSPWTFVNPLRYWNLNMATADSFRVSEGTSPFSFARFALAMTRVDGENGLTCGVPIADTAVNWDEERSQQMFRHIIEDDTGGIPKALCTPSGLPR